MQTFKTARTQVQMRAGRNDWYRITDKLQAKDEEGGGTYAEIYIYDEIGYFGITAQDFVRDLLNIQQDRIDLHLNTPGGEVFDAVAIYQALKDHKATVTTYVDSLAASSGSFIAMAGDKVVMKPHATMMIHNAKGLAIGEAKDMRQLADLLDQTSENIASIYAERSGTDVADWITAMDAETWYTADEAVEAGLADEVAGKESSTAPANSWDLSIFNFSGRDKAPAPKIAEKSETKLDTNLFGKMMREALA